MTPIFLVRHCSALGQEPEALLSAEGKEQARVLAAFLAERGIKRIVSSPYARAVESARPLADQLQVQVEVDDRLAERRLGTVEDGDWLSALRRSFEEPHRSLPSGESTAQAQRRGRVVVDEILAAGLLPTAVFSHGNLLSLIANSFDARHGFDFWKSLSNPDVWALTGAHPPHTLERLWR